MTKLLWHDMTSSSDDLPSYAQSIKLISTTSTTHPVNNDTPDYFLRERCYLNLSMKEDRQPRNRLSLLFHSWTRMFERYTLSTTSFHSQRFVETGCDYFLFHMPGKKDHVTVDIYYSLEHHNGIHTEEVDLLDIKESNNLPSWYPLFQLSYQIIYIDSSPDPDTSAPYVYSDPSDETI